MCGIVGCVTDKKSGFAAEAVVELEKLLGGIVNE
jgi:hypothetical protein